MELRDQPFRKLAPGDVPRPWLQVTIINPHAGKQLNVLGLIDTNQIKVGDFVVKDALIDFMPNLSVPLLGMKNFLSNFILTVDYPNLKFSLRSSEQD